MDDIEEILDWQLNGRPGKRSPNHRYMEKCPHCWGDWHGLPTKECEGSHL